MAESHPEKLFYLPADIDFVRSEKNNHIDWARVLWLVDIEEGGTTQADAASQLSDIAFQEVGKLAKKLVGKESEKKEKNAD